MSINQIRPTDAMFVIDLEHIVVRNALDRKFVDSVKWARALFPDIMVTLVKTDSAVSIAWPENTESAEQILPFLGVSANELKHDIAGPAAGIASLSVYVVNNLALVKSSPSVFKGCDVFLTKLMSL